MRHSPSASVPVRLFCRLAAIVISVGLVSTPAMSQDAVPFDMVEEFQDFCLEPDGNLEWAEEYAAEYGYVPAQERLEAFTPRERRTTYNYIWTRQVEGRDVQLLVNPSAGVWGDGDVSWFNTCSIAVRGENRGRIRNRIARLLGQDSFRQKGTSVFAWMPDGEDRRAVRRNIFEHAGVIVLFNRGMRMVTVSDHEDQVILTYFVPGRDCRVLSVYSPDEPNIYCDRVEDRRTFRRRQ